MEMFSFLSNTIKRYRDVENFSVKEFVLKYNTKFSDLAPVVR